MRYIKLLGLFALVVVLFLGYRTDRVDPEDGGDLTEAQAFPAAVSLTPHYVDDWALPVGPWVTLRPPRKMRPRLYAHAACIVDCQSGAVLYGRRADEPRPIASIVKLLTALVFLESGGDLEQEIEITPDDARNAGKSVLWKTHRFRARDVLYTALLSSDNRAARALARSTPFTPEQFIERMNRRAEEIGCTSLRVAEPTGLSEENVASPVDVARLLSAALANPTIAEICRTYRHRFTELTGKRRYRIVNSNRLLLSRHRVRGGKTGYIVEAGWCVTAMIETEGGPLAVVVLGASSNASRFTQARRLIDWALKYRDRARTFALAP